MKKTDEKEIILLVRSGDKESYRKIIDLYKDKIVKICFYILKDLNDAEDAAQDTFIKGYNALDKFRMESSFYTWLYRIAVNTCKNRLRSKKRTVVGSGDPLYENLTSDNDPADIAKKDNAVRLVEKVISELPDEYRILVVLRDIEGIGYSDIARITGKMEGSVKSGLSRAREMLRVKLKGVWP